jgi:uncharacterized membrane protein YeaQ/YmgE (transglycosylase-associated protein family)
MLVYLLFLALQGLIIGALARLALPGKDPLSLFQTMAIGLVGSFVSGMLAYAAGSRGGAPFFVAFVISVLIVYVIRRRRGGDLLSPSATNPRKPGPYEH